jgi:hypothetical protein
MKTPSRAIPPIITTGPVDPGLVERVISVMEDARRILNPSKDDPDVSLKDVEVGYDFHDNRISSCSIEHMLRDRRFSISTGGIVQIGVTGADINELRIESRAVADRQDALMPYHAAAVLTRAIAVLRRLPRQRAGAVERTTAATEDALGGLVAGLQTSGLTEGGVVVETRRPSVPGRMEVKSRQRFDAERIKALESWALETIPPQISLSLMETPQGRRIMLMHARVGATLSDDPILALRNIVRLPEHLR